MMLPTWLANPKDARPIRFWGRVALKGIGLYLLVNLVYAALNPLPVLERNLLYNSAVPGLERFPGGVYRLPVLFDTHVISRPKAADEYRVILLGDSSTYGAQLAKEDTLAGVLNAAHYEIGGNRVVRVYNLAYPHGSVSRDFMLLDYALHYEPDLVVWLISTNAVRPVEFLNSPLVAENPVIMRDLIKRYDLPGDPNASGFKLPDPFGRTLLGQRYLLYSVLRLQLQGVVWGVSGIDHFWPRELDRVANDFEVEASGPPSRAYALGPEWDSAWGQQVILRAVARLGAVPLLLINEPIFISDGKNSEFFYNDFFPRVVYDVHQQRMDEFVDQYELAYLDLWDLIPPEEFLDTPLHYSPAGAQVLSARVGPAIVALAEGELPH